MRVWEAPSPAEAPEPLGRGWGEPEALLGKAWEGLLHAHKGSLGLNPHAHLGGVSFYPLEPSGLRSIYYVGLSLLRGQWGGDHR